MGDWTDLLLVFPPFEVPEIVLFNWGLVAEAEAVDEAPAEAGPLAAVGAVAVVAMCDVAGSK